MLEVYTAEWCQPCKSLKNLLKTHDIEHKIIDIDKEPDLSRLAGIRGIPTTVNPDTGSRLVGALTLQQVKSILHG